MKQLIEKLIKNLEIYLFFGYNFIQMHVYAILNSS